MRSTDIDCGQIERICSQKAHLHSLPDITSHQIDQMDSTLCACVIKYQSVVVHVYKLFAVLNQVAAAVFINVFAAKMIKLEHAHCTFTASGLCEDGIRLVCLLNYVDMTCCCVVLCYHARFMAGSVACLLAPTHLFNQYFAFHKQNDLCCFINVRLLKLGKYTNYQIRNALEKKTCLQQRSVSLGYSFIQFCANKNYHFVYSLDRIHIVTTLLLLLLLLHRNSIENFIIF